MLYDIAGTIMLYNIIMQPQADGATEDDDNVIKVAPRWRGAEVIAT